MKRLLLLCMVCAGAASAAPAKHVVIISIDGLRPVEYSRADATLVKMPVLRGMAARGCASAGVVPEFPSITYPNHTTMMTGQPPAVHGIVSNAPFDPLGRMPGMAYSFASDIRVPTLWDVVKQHGGTTASISWPVTVGARIDYLVPGYGYPATEAGLALARALSTPGLFAGIESHTTRIDPDKTSDILSDAWRVEAAAYLFARYKPTLTLVHLVESDETQHAYAPGSPRAAAALEELDRLVGELQEKVERAAGTEGVAWLIVSDHGFQSYDHLFHPLVALNGLGYVTYNNAGRPQSWRVQMRNAGGMAALVARDPNDHEAMERTTAYFRFLAGDPQFGIRRLYTRDDLARMGSFPDAFLAFDMADGFAVGGAAQGPLVTVLTAPAGAHGYDPSNPNMHASFILSGAGVAACGSLGSGRLADVAPTAAAILGMEFPASTGKVHTEALAH